jgi:hypothetical protein
VARLVRAYQTHFFRSAQALMTLEDFGGASPDDDIDGGFLSI